MTYLWCRFKGHSLFPERKTLALCHLVGLFYFIGIGSYLSAVAYMPVSLAVLLFYTFPALTTLLAAMRSGRQPRLSECTVLALTFGGIVLALDVTSVTASSLGIGLALLAALGVSVNLLLSETILSKIPQSVFTFHMTVSACLCALVACFAQGAFSLPEPGMAGQLAFAVMLLAFVIAFFSVYASVRLIGPVPLAMMMNLEPVATILFAFALLGEDMTSRQGLGAALVIVTVVISQAIRLHRH